MKEQGTVTLNNRSEKTNRRFFKRAQTHGTYILFFMLISVLPGMMPSYKQQEVYEDLPNGIAAKKDIAGGCEKKDTHFSQHRNSPHETGKQTTPPQLVFDLEPSSPSEKWKTVYDAITECAQLDLTVWYAFGSARLKIQPEGRQCRMDWFIEGELTETNHRQGFTCLGDPVILKELDLVHDGEVLRETPPKKLPEALKPFCRPVPANQ